MALEHGYWTGVLPVNSDGSGDASGEGEVRLNYDASGRASKSVYLRNFAAATAVVGQPYIYSVAGLAGSGQIAIDPAAVATVNREMVIATAATARNSFGWYTYWGVTTAYVSGNVAVSKGDWLKLAPATAGTALVQDSASARSNSSTAVARAAGPSVGNPSSSLTEVFLLGDRAVINT